MPGLIFCDGVPVKSRMRVIKVSVIKPPPARVLFSQGGEIAEGIINDEIHDGVPFVLKSRDWKLAMAIGPNHVEGTYWKLVIITVFPESEYNSFRVGKEQLVLEL